jgi:hypothetical protein
VWASRSSAAFGGSLDLTMTRTRLEQIWRNLWFWQRALLECSFAVALFLLLELIINGRAGNFAGSALEGLVLGLFYAVLDHAIFSPNRKRANRHR